MRWSHPILIDGIDGSDLRFAVPRCWSGGDSNRRSSLWFLALTKGLKFQRGRCAKADRRIILHATSWQIRAQSGWTSVPFLNGKRPKRSGGSNPLCSSNASVRTGGPAPWNWLPMAEPIEDRPWDWPADWPDVKPPPAPAQSTHPRRRVRDARLRSPTGAGAALARHVFRMPICPGKRHSPNHRIQI
jgi:hypothetical protein